MSAEPVLQRLLRKPLLYSLALTKAGQSVHSDNLADQGQFVIPLWVYIYPETPAMLSWTIRWFGFMFTQSHHQEYFWGQS